MTKQCQQCSKTFQITASDQVFYQKISVPAPTLCPDCRQQRRLAWRNEHTMFNRPCDLCHKPIISIYPAETVYTIYCSDCWLSDQWTALDYGQEIDFAQPFFTQWNKLFKAVPKMALTVIANENSNYVNMTGHCKDCYLVFAGDYDEDCLYSSQIIKSISCVDTLNCIESEDCYEVVDVEKCYRLWFAQNCKHCTDSLFLFDCRGCTDCLFSTNLRNKQYYIYNKHYSPEAYTQEKGLIMEKLRQGKLTELLTKFEELKIKAIHRPLEQASSEQVSGDFIFNSHAAYQCYDVTGIDQCAYVYTGFHVKDLMDVCHTTDIELAYEGSSLGYQSYNCKFSIGAWSATNCVYSIEIEKGHDLFGCVGLKQEKFCILNKPYSETDYKQLQQKLITHMKQTGEWGEFFPITMSPFAYNESMAQMWYPLTSEQTRNHGWLWRENTSAAGSSVTNSNTLVCAVTGKPYRTVQAELDFYQRMGLPIPQLCPDERRRQRFQLRNPRQLWQRQCMCTQIDHSHHGRCSTEFSTTYSPERKELVYCEGCYQKEVT